MTRPAPDPHAAIRFAENALQLLDQGSFVATYKYAVLLGLMDLSLEGTGRLGAPPPMITTRQLAEKVIELYWPQTRPYDAPGASGTLRQNTGGQARMVSDIITFRQSLVDRHHTLYRARIQDPLGFARLVDQVEWTLILMPLPRLQCVGGVHRPLLYTIAWDRGVERQRRQVTAYQKALRGADPSRAATEFNNGIRLLPGVGEHLVLLSGLLRPIIHREWARFVAQINHLEQSHLESFLFGAERTSTVRLVPGLRDLQDNRCFYCAKRIKGPAEVDHFIPWARHPDDAIENLVLADERCNRDKRDFLAAPDHMSHWTARLDPSSSQSTDLATLAATQRWESAPSRALGTARALYFRLRDDALLWQRPTELIPADPAAIRQLLLQAG